MNRLNKKRVELNKSILDDFSGNVLKGHVSELSKKTALPYSLIYNLANDRIKSLLVADYWKIFGKEPPEQKPKRVNGEYFREMVRLWLFLNDNVTEKELYEEFYNREKTIKKIDYRIFNGSVKTVEYRLERNMEQKFLEQGLEKSKIKEWIKEVEFISHNKRVAYEKVKQILYYLETHLKAHPSRLLKQSLPRYERGELKTVSEEIYHRLLILKEKTEMALSSGRKFETEKIREEIYGKREGFTPYDEVIEELNFLKTIAGKSPRKYLSRSDSNYKKGKLINLAAWRLKKIREDCLDTIRNRPEISLSSLPKAFLSKEIQKLIFFFRSYTIVKLCDDEGIEFERRILTPKYLEKEISKHNNNVLVRFDDTARFLDMKRKAFDYLVAKHVKIFKKIVKSHHMRWYIPDSYLKVLAETVGFSLIREKYNLLATNGKQLCIPHKGTQQHIIGRNEKDGEVITFDKNPKCCDIETTNNSDQKMSFKFGSGNLSCMAA